MPSTRRLTAALLLVATLAVAGCGAPTTQVPTPEEAAQTPTLADPPSTTSKSFTPKQAPP